ncbi:hypothetical protein B0H12DRAFT_1088537 [Mycena haematopus]|nr:hypothetical protein B0H12DRAFT_1088537 [Mycena haematopus]
MNHTNQPNHPRFHGAAIEHYMSGNRFERRALGRVRVSNANTEMRGASGEPYSIVARVGIGCVVLSIHCEDAGAPSSWRPSASLRRPATSSPAARIWSPYSCANTRI